MSITKKELLKLLENIPDNYLIVASSDEEGNSFNTVWKTEIGTYNHKTREFETLVDKNEKPIIAPEFNAVCLWT